MLTFILLSIAVSGGDFKSDCFKWWSKAVRLASSLELNREDERCSAVVSPCANPLCSCKREQETFSLSATEGREERRRVFWLLYCLDRHLALSFNRELDIPDSYCEIYGMSTLLRLCAQDLQAYLVSQHHFQKQFGKTSTPFLPKTCPHAPLAHPPPSQAPASSST